MTSPVVVVDYVTALWISPNGFVQVHGEECGRGYRYCTFDETDGMFAPLHVDLDPSSAVDAVVSYYVNQTVRPFHVPT
jgi:hypothetical protein